MTLCGDERFSIRRFPMRAVRTTVFLSLALLTLPLFASPAAAQFRAFGPFGRGIFGPAFGFPFSYGYPGFYGPGYGYGYPYGGYGGGLRGHIGQRYGRHHTPGSRAPLTPATTPARPLACPS